MFPAIPLTDLVIYGVTFLFGLVILFWGYRLLRFWLVLAGLQSGIFLGLWLGSRLFQNQVLTLVLTILCGVLCAGLFLILVRVGAFLAGGGLLVLLACLVMMMLPSGINLYVLLGAFLAGGLLGVLSVRPFLIICTAANGAFLVVDSISCLVRSSPAAQYLAIHSQLSGAVLILMLVGLTVLTIVGAMVQFLMEHRRGRRLRQPAGSAVQPDLPVAEPAPPADGQASGPDNPPEQK